MGIAGKVVAITGASSGIGRATAILLAEAGATVVLGARREDILAEVARDIAAVGGKVAYKQTDVRVRADLDALVALAVERGGRLDVIVNNAGISPISRFDALRVEDWDAMIDVNLRGTLYGIAAALPRADPCGPSVGLPAILAYSAVWSQCAVFADNQPLEVWVLWRFLRSAQSRSARKVGRSASPISVSWYSTLGGT
jgi:NAD(P)-dependent dehydrogenase (short-subunit alcohol dehydrogenase family)